MIALRDPDFSGNELKYLTDVIERKRVTRDYYVRKVEDFFSAKFGKRCLMTCSGTAALVISLQAMGIAQYDEVLVPSLTFAATASAVRVLGGSVRMCDVYPDTWGIDTTGRESDMTFAAMPVNLYGMRADLPGNLLRVEDACESLGFVDPVGDHYICYSFYGNKLLTSGEGGMIVNADDATESWRDGGFAKDYNCLLPALNFRPSEMQAAVLLAQAERMESILAGHMECLEKYRAALPGRGNWLFCLRTDDPRGLAQHLQEAGIDSRPIFYPLHRSEPFRDISRFPVSDAIWSGHLCLPTGAHVDTNAVIEAVQRYGNHNLRAA